MKRLLRALGALLCCSMSLSNTLDPDGKNVCQNISEPSKLVCCTGWRQAGRECTIPVCEGEDACLKDELCVYPGVCRCPPGYYGAHCKTSCPPEFWAPDCREVCKCYPHGRCHPVTGQCTCNANRWGPLCQFPCKCTRHGRCHPLHGNCSCDEGWWTPTCSKPCHCASGGSVSSACDQLTGRCQCCQGYWGQKCFSPCKCYLSPCHQRTGACECLEGWWGLSCNQPCNCDLAHSSCDPADGQCLCQPGYHDVYCNRSCEAGKYGRGCNMSCGHCKDGHRCSATDGVCAACKPGWNNTRCDRPCPAGYYGERCGKICPHCRNNEPCDAETGNCRRCDPGWTGPRCEEVCSDRMYGDDCSFRCSPCYHGNCHHVTGRCVCQAGFQGESCNSSCPALQYGLNCSSACDCGEGISCHPVTGTCLSSGRGALLAGVLVPLLLVLLAVLCCCLCCGGSPTDSKDRVTVGEGDVLARMKYHVYSVLANIGAALPCVSDWSSGLPRVTVSHHDPEVTFNHSFIEPPSYGWVTEGSSFDSDEEEGEALYCVPPREDIPAVAGGEFQEMASKCNMFLDPSGFSNEDIASPFNIPRTSSIAKSKRPSVSFAQGTRFSPKERRGSAQDSSTLPGHLRTKPKSTWGALMLSALQSQAGTAKTGEEGAPEGEKREDGVDGEEMDNQESNCEAADLENGHATSQVPVRSGQRCTTSNTAAHKGTPVPGPACDAQVGISDKVTTVYVTVGKAGRPVSKVESFSESPVQAMLRRLGSLQRQREQESDRPKNKSTEGMMKPPRRKLGARASMWEQGRHSGEVRVCKPIRKKHASFNSSDTVDAKDAPPSETGTPTRPLSSILKNIPAVVPADSGLDLKAEEANGQGSAFCTGQMEANYLTIGPAADSSNLTQDITDDGAEPNYENVFIKPPQPLTDRRGSDSNTDA
ncbi:scavenger receptor class F member 1 [Thalassophryne amazonica]|uniref:scavenger receptor class F member 1 n=1 Tax=Thalassophryne amazonica TaxID=390379 RepID=UPI001471CF61|nr:scavenger receptor class F member 1 [Thalassophryne amazonica]